MHRLFFSIFLLTLSCIYANAINKVDTRTQIFNPNFKTLQVTVEGNELFPPVINLDGSTKINISFDELSTDMRYLRYSLTHCNADWQPSQLIDSEYIDGFNYANVEDYSFSSGTFANYVHYNIGVPNENMKFTKSGNYLLSVYPEDNPDNILLQARFSVSENQVKVYPDITSRTDIDYNDKNQQVSFSIATQDYPIRDLYNDLQVVVSQNSRSDNEVEVTRPLLVENKKATFEHNKSLIFPAGNEYRRFEVVATNYAGMGVEAIEHHNPYYHIILAQSEPRVGSPYSYDKTQNGRFKIRQSSALDSETNADYVIVHFTLDMPQQVGGDIYVDGDFTYNIFNNTNKLAFNPATGKYEISMFLKMGSYNYQYLWVPTGAARGETSKIEGDKYQTVNEYLIKVYHRPIGERYDRLIGFGIGFSGR